MMLRSPCSLLHLDTASALQKCPSLSESIWGLSRSTDLFITCHSVLWNTVLWDIVYPLEMEIMGEAIGLYYLNSENIRMTSKVQ